MFAFFPVGKPDRVFTAGTNERPKTPREPPCVIFTGEYEVTEDSGNIIYMSTKPTPGKVRICWRARDFVGAIRTEQPVKGMEATDDLLFHQRRRIPRSATPRVYNERDKPRNMLKLMLHDPSCTSAES